MFRTRLISGIILVAVALLTIISGGIVLFFTTLALSLIGAGELYNATKVRGNKPFGILDTVGYAVIAFYYVTILLLPQELWLMPIIFGFLAIMFAYVITYPKYRAFQVMSAFFGVVYTGVMISCIYLTRMIPDGGRYHVWLIFISAWGADTCAYCAGMLFGKRKMAPVLSPKKSWEGAIGGLCGAVILAVIYAIATRGPVAIYALICAAGAVLSMIGDLAASAIKRNMEIKDYCLLSLVPSDQVIRNRYEKNCHHGVHRFHRDPDPRYRKKK